MVAPRDESLALVIEWLDSENMTAHSTLSARGDTVLVEASISRVEKLLKAEYSAFGTVFLDHRVDHNSNTK